LPQRGAKGPNEGVTYTTRYNNKVKELQAIFGGAVIEDYDQAIRSYLKSCDPAIEGYDKDIGLNPR
jgi:hypothetical protein